MPILHVTSRLVGALPRAAATRAAGFAAVHARRPGHLAASQWMARNASTGAPAGPQMAGPERESAQSVDYLAAEEDNGDPFPDVPRASHHLYTENDADQPTSNVTGSRWQLDLEVKTENGTFALRVPRSPQKIGTDLLIVKHAREPGGVETEYLMSSVFLRDMCRCTACLDPSTRQRKVFPYMFNDIDVIGISTQDCAEGTFNVLFRNRLGKVPEENNAEHITQISVQALAEHLHIAKKPDTTAPVTGWSRYSYEHQSSDGARASYDSFLNNPDTFKRVLRKLDQYGLVFIHGVPESEESVEKLGEAIGPLRHTFYGRTWDVKDKPNATNVAYTSGFLGLHMDLMYMKNPPGLQLLHCIRSSSEGGESIFADSFYAAASMFKRDRRNFEILADFPITYGYEHGDKGLFFRDTKPVFEIDHYTLRSSQGTVRDPFHLFNTPPPIKYVNWSPPFQNPSTSFHIDGGWKIPATLPRWRAAAARFQMLLERKSAQYRHKLQPGECVIFNNRRVLHGRERFVSQPGSGERFLKGAYVDTDDFESKLRCMKLPH